MENQKITFLMPQLDPKLNKKSFVIFHLSKLSGRKVSHGHSHAENMKYSEINKFLTQLSI